MVMRDFSVQYRCGSTPAVFTLRRWRLTLRTSAGSGYCSYGRNLEILGRPNPMLTHAQIWKALDRLAARAGLSTSGLAKKAGLDSTAFNVSKRISADGRQRWPSTESVAKSLAATGTPIEVFVQLIGDGGHAIARQSVPMIGLGQAAKPEHFDAAGFPTGDGWDEISLPAVEDEHAYALEISGRSMEPTYREGTVILLSPAASSRRGDRAVVKTRGGDVIVKELMRRTGRTIELRSLDRGQKEQTFPARDVFWMHRLVWASQ
jgi:phage repressor protein C with HTH and peptisase S24 domain